MGEEEEEEERETRNEDGPLPTRCPGEVMKKGEGRKELAAASITVIMDTLLTFCHSLFGKPGEARQQVLDADRVTTL